jgi:hypothetical protein
MLPNFVGLCALGTTTTPARDSTELWDSLTECAVQCLLHAGFELYPLERHRSVEAAFSRRHNSSRNTAHYSSSARRLRWVLEALVVNVLYAIACQACSFRQCIIRRVLRVFNQFPGFLGFHKTSFVTPVAISTPRYYTHASYRAVLK